MKKEKFLSRLKKSKKAYIMSEGKKRVVEDIWIFDIDFPASACPEYDSLNRFHRENAALPDMVIHGKVGEKELWWDREGKYYEIKDIKGLHGRDDIVRVPELDLRLEEDD